MLNEKISLSGSFMLLLVPMKEEKSCLPISACAAFIIDSSSRGCRTIHAYMYRNAGNFLDLTVWYGSSPVLYGVIETANTGTQLAGDDIGLRIK